jgi:hypothetical protein
MESRTATRARLINSRQKPGCHRLNSAMILYYKGLRAASAVLIFSAIVAPARADISVLLSPQPVSVTRSFGVTMVDVWTIRACNAGAVNVTVAPERIYEAVPTVFFLDTVESQAVLAQSHLHSRWVKIARYIEGAVLLATLFTGSRMVTASPKVVVTLGLSTSAAHEIGDLIENAAPNTTAISSILLTEPLTLGPGACATRLGLANLQSGTTPVSVVIQ